MMIGRQVGARERGGRIEPALWSKLVMWALLAGCTHVATPTWAQTSGGRSPATQKGASSADEDAQLAAEAQEALRSGNYTKAIEDLEKLVKDAPGYGEIHANLALAYYSVGRFHEAADQSRQAVKLKPALTNAHFILGLSLAEGGNCPDALPYLTKDYPRATTPAMKRAIGTDALRCYWTMNDADKATGLIPLLNRDFPDDPDLLYLSSHIYSDLATQSSQRLLTTAPGSYQAHQLNAEVLEIQGKPSEAAEEYRKVLSIRPDLPGIHYQLGELVLASGGSDAQNQAKQEFLEELKIDPRNAAAEYELGEIARQSRQWDEAIQHFERASTLDSGFSDALIGLGKSLVSAGRAQEAVAPLERAVRVNTGDPNAHYQLSFAYRRLGREPEAAKELAAYREIHDKQQSTKLRIRTGILGNLAQPQTETPPE